MMIINTPVIPAPRMLSVNPNARRGRARR